MKKRFSFVILSFVSGCPFAPTGITVGSASEVSSGESTGSTGYKPDSTGKTPTTTDINSTSGLITEGIDTSLNTDSTSDISTTFNSSSSSSETSETFGESTTGIPFTCGDGNNDPGEECDDEIDKACRDCIKDRLIFVTSSKFYPSEINQIGADQICYTHAAAAGIATYGFIPLLHYSNLNAFDNVEFTNGRYILTNGLIFAEHFLDIKSNMILNPPMFDEYGIERIGPVWVGDWNINADNCNDWTYDGSNNIGIIGQSSSLRAWLFSDENLCNNERPIYCLQDKKWWDQL